MSFCPCTDSTLVRDLPALVSGKVYGTLAGEGDALRGVCFSFWGEVFSLGGEGEADVVHSFLFCLLLFFFFLREEEDEELVSPSVGVWWGQRWCPRAP